MKKNFTIALFVLFTYSAAYSQFSVGMHSGISNKSKNVILGFHSQYQFKNKFTAGVNLTTHTDNSNPTFVQSRFGYMLGNPEGLTIQPYIGYSYSMHGSEIKEPTGQFTTGFQLRFYLTPRARVYADLNMPASRYYFFSIGITGML